MKRENKRITFEENKELRKLLDRVIDKTMDCQEKLNACKYFSLNDFAKDFGQVF